MCNREWPKNRVIIEVVDVEGHCPVYHVGDVIVIDEPRLVLPETDALCVRAMGPLMTHIISAAGGIDPSAAAGGVLHYLANPDMPAEQVTHYTQCPMPGKPYSEYGPVLFRIRLEGIATNE
ncbi:hypothetical protein AC480_03315 [miscellaneous Crenarchaeota group archaeon SMTZ1-55]|nr:MAG: hypothetical protein AC480_03315 [miscellaneous Crenarchaeota group archaeon SMTZ1-55]